MTKIARPGVAGRRVVNTLLADELAAGFHALAVEPAAPGEKTRR